MQIFFFSLIPLGIIVLLLSLKFVQKAFSGRIILEIPYSQKAAEFTLNEPGTYAVWHKGQYFRRAPLDEFKPEIIDRSTGLGLKLSSFILRPNTNNGATARMEIARFSASPGKYVLQLSEGSTVSGVEQSLIRLLNVKMVDYDKYFIQIRESRPVSSVLIGILLLAFSGLCIFGGLVAGILSDQILKH